MLTILLCFWLQDQPVTYSGLPSYPPKSKMVSYQRGTKPGSKAVNRNVTEGKFIRAEYLPVSAKFLIRTNCSTSVTNDEIIEYAKQNAGLNSGLSQIDWGPVDTDKDIMFYIVIYSHKRLTKYELQLSNDTYQPTNRSKDDIIKWEVETLRFPGQAACLADSEFTSKKIKVAMQNLLIYRNNQWLKGHHKDLEGYD